MCGETFVWASTHNICTFYIIFHRKHAFIMWHTKKPYATSRKYFSFLMHKCHQCVTLLNIKCEFQNNICFGQIEIFVKITSTDLYKRFLSNIKNISDHILLFCRKPMMEYFNMCLRVVCAISLTVAKLYLQLLNNVQSVLR